MLSDILSDYILGDTLSNIGNDLLSRSQIFLHSVRDIYSDIFPGTLLDTLQSTSITYLILAHH